MADWDYIIIGSGSAGSALALLQEEVVDSDDLRSTQLSALVEQVEYIYWDERFEAWEIEEEPLKGDGQDQFLLPRYLRFTFTHEGVSETRNLAIPALDFACT